MIIIAERINTSRKSINQAVRDKNAEFIMNEAKAQDEAGATYIDVNAGSFMETEVDELKWIIEQVQKATSKPLCIDSPDPKVIKQVLPMIDRKPIMINSINLESQRLEGLLPLVAEYNANVIGLCQTESTMASTVSQKVDMAGQLVEKVESAGIPRQSLYIDPLVYPISTDHKTAQASLEAIEIIMKTFQGVHTTGGLTNVSYGLPVRKLVNRAFLVCAINRGLDSAIIDPTDKSLYGALRAAALVSGHDDFCMTYISDFRAGRLE